MTLLKPEQTQPYNERDKKNLMETVPGMAHFAGTGPDGMTCAQCEEFKSFSSGGNPIRTKQQPCQKFRRMMKAKTSPKIPRKMSACMFFTPKESA